MFVLYALIGVASALVYRKLPAGLATESEASAAPLHRSKRIVYVLAALFSLDAFGGGFIVQSMLALWLFEKFQLSTAVAGTIFFWTGVLTAFSYLVAVRIANRIGLINTMVFTHLPSSVLLVLMPFVPDLGWVIVLLLVRSALSQMDVPTRSSYVMAVVSPGERAGRREHHFGAAKPRIGDQSAACRLSAGPVELRLAAGRSAARSRSSMTCCCSRPAEKSGRRKSCSGGLRDAMMAWLRYAEASRLRRLASHPPPSAPNSSASVPGSGRGVNEAVCGAVALGTEGHRSRGAEVVDVIHRQVRWVAETTRSGTADLAEARNELQPEQVAAVSGRSGLGAHRIGIDAFECTVDRNRYRANQNWPGKTDPEQFPGWADLPARCCTDTRSH